MTTIAPRTATTAVELTPLVADRWSPRAFDRSPLSDADVTALLEAARWAPSANNYQPWRFLVGRQGAEGADATYKGIYDALAEFNQLWASAAPVLVAAVVEVEHEDGSAREIAPYELGLAVSQLTVEAAARGRLDGELRDGQPELVRRDLAGRAVLVLDLDDRGDQDRSRGGPQLVELGEGVQQAGVGGVDAVGRDATDEEAPGLVVVRARRPAGSLEQRGHVGVLERGAVERPRRPAVGEQRVQLDGGRGGAGGKGGAGHRDSSAGC